MDHHQEPDQTELGDDQPSQADRAKSSKNVSDPERSSYYYDDSTGYEAYEDEDDGEEEDSTTHQPES